jgi:hypothetical protein
MQVMRRSSKAKHDEASNWKDKKWHIMSKIEKYTKVNNFALNFATSFLIFLFTQKNPSLSLIDGK